ECRQVAFPDRDRPSANPALTQSDLALAHGEAIVVVAVRNIRGQRLNSQAAKDELAQIQVQVAHQPTLREPWLGEERKTRGFEVSGGDRHLVEVAEGAGDEAA